MNQIYYIIGLVVLIACTGLSQSKVNFIEANLTLTQNQGHFKRNIQEDLFGLEFGYLRQLKLDKPIFWGISIYYTKLGNNSGTFQEVVDFEIFDFDYTTTSNLLGFNGKVRFYPTLYLGKIETYIEAQLGYKWLFTNTTRSVVGDSDSSDTNTEKGALSLTYGGAIGINIPLNNRLYLNFRANYLPGLSVPYYAYNYQNELVSSTLDGFDLKRSTTNIVRWDLGIIYRF